eukprot:jgi/Botrbrau1/3434/Bobra.139_1s0014.1
MPSHTVAEGCFRHALQASNPSTSSLSTSPKVTATPIPGPGASKVAPTPVSGSHAPEVGPATVPGPHASEVNPTPIPGPDASKVAPTPVPSPHASDVDPAPIPGPHASEVGPAPSPVPTPPRKAPPPSPVLKPPGPPPPRSPGPSPPKSAPPPSPVPAPPVSPSPRSRPPPPPWNILGSFDCSACNKAGCHDTQYCGPWGGRCTYVFPCGPNPSVPGHCSYYVCNVFGFAVTNGGARTVYRKADADSAASNIQLDDVDVTVDDQQEAGTTVVTDQVIVTSPSGT